MALVNGTGLAAVYILEHEELMLQKVHLKNSFLCGHGLDREGLCANLEFALLGNIAAFVFGNTNVVPQPFCKSRFVFSYLPFNGIHAAVKSINKGRAFVLAAEQEGSLLNRYLNPLYITDSGKLDSGFGFSGEKPVEFCKLLFDVLSQVIVNRDFACVNGDFHFYTHPSLDSEKEFLLCEYIIPHNLSDVYIFCEIYINNLCISPLV